MLIRNVCLNCRRYYPNVLAGACPRCGGRLQDVQQNPWETYTRDETGDAAPQKSASSQSEGCPGVYSTAAESQQDPWGIGGMPQQAQSAPYLYRQAEPTAQDSSYDTQPYGGSSQQNDFQDGTAESEIHNPETSLDEGFFHYGEFTGRITSFKRNTHRRLIFTQIYQKLLFHQALGSDVNHFVVTDDSHQTHFVVAHGEISGGGADPEENTYVTVSGRFNSHSVLMIMKMRIVNGPDIDFRTPADVVHRILRCFQLPLMILLLGAGIYLILKYLPDVKSFFIELLIIFLISFFLLYALFRILFVGRHSLKRSARAAFFFSVTIVVFYLLKRLGIL